MKIRLEVKEEYLVFQRWDSFYFELFKIFSNQHNMRGHSKDSFFHVVNNVNMLCFYLTPACWNFRSTMYRWSLTTRMLVNISPAKYDARFLVVHIHNRNSATGFLVLISIYDGEQEELEIYFLFCF